jgi:hypothetical protein
MNVFFLLLLNIITIYGFINPIKFNIKSKLLCTSEVELIGDNNMNNPNYYKFGYFPRLEGPNINGVLTWYPIGFSKDSIDLSVLLRIFSPRIIVVIIIMESSFIFLKIIV